MAIKRIYLLCPNCGIKNQISRDTVAGLGGSGERVRTLPCKYCGKTILDEGDGEIERRGRD